MTDRYAVFGNPIAQSKSPEIHAEFARATGQDMAYVRVEPPLDGFEASVARFVAAGGKGINITAPFKLQALALATHPSEAARRAGAANALRFAGGRIEAENFDGVAIVRDIVHNLGRPLAGAHVLLLGAGGAVRGVLHPLMAEAPARLVVANRTPARAREVVEQYGSEARLAWCGDDALGGERFDIVIDGTSAGLAGQTPRVPASAFVRCVLAYEMVYGKGLTPFLRLARECGVPQLADGVGMLVEQAAESFRWWRGVRPPTAAVIEKIAVPLA